MFYIEGIEVGFIDTKFLYIRKNKLNCAYSKDNIRISIKDSETGVIYNSIDFNTFSIITQRNFDKVFGVVDKGDCLYIFKVDYSLWKLLDYIDSPIKIAESGDFRNWKDFLRYIKNGSNLVGTHQAYNVIEFSGSDRSAKVLFAKENYTYIDNDKIFWLNINCSKMCPISGNDIFYTEGSDSANILDFYKILLDNNIEFDGSTEVYLFFKGFNSSCYKLQLDNDIARFLTKLKCIGK